MAEPTLFVGAMLVLFIVTAGRRFGHFSVVSLFTYAQSVMAFGTLPMLSHELEADRTHAALIMFTFGAVVVTAIVYSFAAQGAIRQTYSPSVNFDYPKFGVWAWIFLSIAISALYFVAVGYLAFFEALSAVVNETGEDVAGLRLESYAGSRYLFPGYVNQFKNSFLPVLALVVIAVAFQSRASFRWLLAIVLGSTTIVFLLGTGQRGAFVTAAIMAVVFVYYLTPKKTAKITLGLTIVVLPLFFLSTFASGRATSDLQSASSPLSAVGVLFDQLGRRLLGSNQLTSTVGFRYIYSLDVPFASEWVKSFEGLLPGSTGSSLSNEIFGVLYGSTRGTAPLSIWGAAFHNLGMVGAIVFAILLMLLFCTIATHINRTVHSNVMTLAGVAGITATLGTWIADGPVTVLNKGLIVFVFLWWWGRRFERQQALSGRPRVVATIGYRRSK